MIIQKSSYIREVGMYPVRIVIGYNEGAVTPYVTHVQSDDGSRYWGHYFATLTDACKDYEKRVVDLFGKVDIKMEAVTTLVL